MAHDTALERFTTAQEGAYHEAKREITAGQKVGHWIWFIYPQLRGLGRSEMARKYGIADLDEAAAYLAHPVLGPRLVEMCELLLAHDDKSAAAILGDLDAIKVRSSATLFRAVPDAPDAFDRVLATFYDGPDPETERRL